MNKLVEQLIKMTKTQNKAMELSHQITRKEVKIKYLSENARQLNEIILVDTLKDLTIEEKYRTVLDIANYYVQHLQDKIIELDSDQTEN